MKEDTSADTHKMTITAKPRSPCKDMKQSLRNFVPVGAFTIGGGGGGKERGGGRGRVVGWSPSPQHVHLSYQG